MGKPFEGEVKEQLMGMGGKFGKQCSITLDLAKAFPRFSSKRSVLLTFSDLPPKNKTLRFFLFLFCLCTKLLNIVIKPQSNLQPLILFSSSHGCVFLGLPSVKFSISTLYFHFRM